MGLLIFGLTLPRREPQQATLPIDAVVVDDAVLEAAGQKRSNEERLAAEQKKREEAEAEDRRVEEERLKQEEEQLRKEEEQKRQEEQQRLEAEQAAEQKARAEAEAKQKTEAEAKQQAEQQAQAKAAAEKKRAAAEARLRQESEADLRARLAEEETRTSAGFQGLKSEYVRAIQAHVEQRWYEPPGNLQGLSCTVFVMQIPGGEVVGMRFGSCNGNAAVRQSIETAVRNSSPLPAPPEPALFEREVQLVFTPKEPRR
ncbi:MAG: cell envelope integrity protein TolA [Steroidobacteraceae bacterium]